MDSLTNLLNNNLDVTNLTSVHNTIGTIEKYMNNLSSQVEEAVKKEYSDVSMAETEAANKVYSDVSMAETEAANEEYSDVSMAETEAANKEYSDVSMAETEAVYQKSKQYASEFQLLNNQISKDLEVEVVSTEDTQKVLMNRMLRSESMVSILHQLCQCHELVEGSSDTSNIREEAEKLKLAEVTLKSLCNLKQAPSVVVDMQDKIQDRLLEIFKTSSDWSTIVTIQNETVHVSEGARSLLDNNIHVLEVIAKSELETIADLMASKMIKEILLPILDKHLKIVVGGNVVSLTKSSGPRISCLKEIINFFVLVDDKILPSSQSFRANFWRNIFEEFIPEVKEFVKEEIPERISDLGNFAEESIPAVETFENRIQGFDDSYNASLTAYISDYHFLFAQKYKERCYNDARRILMSENKTVVTISQVLDKPGKTVIRPPRDPCSPLTLNYPNTNNLLRLPEFPVSEKVVDLVKLISNILREATCKTLSRAASECLCETSRNIAELFQVPSFAPFEETENPQRAARFFCDCWYLSHALFWETIVLKQQLPSENFFDIISFLRSKGAATLKNNSDGLFNKIQILVKQIGGLDGSNKENHGMVIEMAFVQIVALINQFAGAWKKNLPKDKYENLVGSTIDRTLHVLTAETLTIQDISAKHSTCLSNNFSLLLDQLLKVRSDDLPEDSECWIRFKLIIALMDDNLVKIVENWENGTLSKYFRSSEIQHLTRALFQNTDKNAALRRRITGDIL